MTFGEWLTRKRREVRLSQKELANRVGISATYISALERDEPNSSEGSARRPRVEKVDKIAEALGVDPAEARIAAGYIAQRLHETEIAPGVRLSFMDGNLTEAERAEVGEELGFAYKILMARFENRKH